jgi:hypothetical protein
MKFQVEKTRKRISINEDRSANLMFDIKSDYDLLMKLILYEPCIETELIARLHLKIIKI